MSETVLLGRPLSLLKVNEAEGNSRSVKIFDGGENFPGKFSNSLSLLRSSSQRLSNGNQQYLRRLGDYEDQQHKVSI
jgi:hypothetical protein